MARMYFGFYANGWDENLFVPVDYIAFETKRRNGEVIHISVSCNGDSNFGADNDHIFECRFKGLEVNIEKFDKDNEEIEDADTHDYEDIIRRDYDLLKNAKPYEIGFDSEYNKSVKCPNIVYNLDIDIFFYDPDAEEELKLSFHKNKCETITY